MTRISPLAEDAAEEFFDGLRPHDAMVTLAAVMVAKFGRGQAINHALTLTRMIGEKRDG